MISGCSLLIVLDRPEGVYRGGEQVTGRVEVVVTSDTACNGLRIDRCWRTSGKGNRDFGPRESITVFRGQWKAGQHYHYPFRFIAPAAPLSYRGPLVQVEHLIETCADVPWAIDPKASKTFEVQAGGSGGPDESPARRAFLGSEEIAAAVRGKPGLVGGGIATLLGSMMLPFGIVFFVPGLIVFLYALWHTLAVLATGDVQVQLASPALHPGVPQDLTITMTPTKSLRLGRVTAVLRGIERCVKGSGKSRKVRKRVLHERTTVLSEPRELPAGKTLTLTAPLPVPQTDAMSFSAVDNSIEWDLRIRIAIPFWPDWTRRIPILMAPAKVIVTDQRRPEAVVVAPAARPAPPPPLPEYAPIETAASQPPPPEPEPAPSAEPAPVREPAKPREPQAPDGVVELLQRVAAADRFSGTRQKIVEGAAGQPFTFTIEAQRVEWTLGLNAAPEFRSGRTIIGTLDGSGLPVAVRFPQDRNAGIEATAPGTRLAITARLAEWNALHDRGEFEVLRSE